MVGNVRANAEDAAESARADKPIAAARQTKDGNTALAKVIACVEHGDAQYAPANDAALVPPDFSANGSDKIARGGKT